MRPGTPLSVVLISALMVGTACRGPASPSPAPGLPAPPPAPGGVPPPAPVTVTVTRLTIAGPDSVAPGQTLQLTATAEFSDGTSRDVTTTTSWESHNSGLMSISSSGVITAADARGEGDIIARYLAVPPARLGANTASREQFVLPPGTYRLHGSIRDEDVYLDRVRVELTSGPAAGMSVTANGFFYFYGVSGDTEIRVSKEGYDTEIQRAAVTSHRTVEFRLVPSRPRPVLDGRYTLTVSAAAECRSNLPEQLRERSYAVVVSQTGARLTMAIEAAPVRTAVPRYPTNRINGTVEPHRLHFWLYGAFAESVDDLSQPTMLEEVITPETEAGVFSKYFNISGVASAASTDSGYAGTLNGSFEVLTLPGPWDYGQPLYTRGSTCQSSSHRFTLSR